MNNVFIIIAKHKNKFGFLLLMLAAGYFYVNQHINEDDIATFMPIENIKIEGKFENLVQMDMQNAVESVLQGGYFTVDISLIRQALLQLPWVEGVSIRRQWPASLNIAVTEKHAIAFWGKNQMLSAKGKLFSPETMPENEAIPYLEGPDNLYKSVWAFLKDTNKKIKELDVVVKRLVIDKRRSWEMQLSNNVIVKLGRENTESRLQRFINVFSLKNAPKLQNIELIDLRYPNGFAMRIKTIKLTLSESALVKEV